MNNNVASLIRTVMKVAGGWPIVGVILGWFGVTGVDPGVFIDTLGGVVLGIGTIWSYLHHKSA